MIQRIANRLLGISYFLRRITRKDASCILIVLLLAAGLRLPYLSFPNVTEFDELVYADNTLFLLEGITFADTHPPLARMLFTEIARPYMPLETSVIPLGGNIPFGDFPFVPERTFVAVIGILLTLVVYLIGRVVTLSPPMAMLPALCVVFDNALTIFSRTIHADMIMILFGFLTLLAVLLLVRASSERRIVVLILLAGIAGGLALSVKWIALGVVACAWLLLAIHKKFSALIAVMAISVAVYIAVFASFFVFYIPNGGKAVNLGLENTPAYVGNITFPVTHSFGEALRYLPSYHKVMFATNYDQHIVGLLPKAGHPLLWIVSEADMRFWSILDTSDPHEPGDIRTVTVTGNAPLWAIVFLAYLFNCCWIVERWLKERKMPVKKSELVLMIGYLANYIPFFFIDRPMYVYHYFNALIFLFLLLPFALPRIRHSMINTVHDRWFAPVFIVILLGIALINFVMLIPETYGTHSWSYLLAHLP